MRAHRPDHVASNYIIVPSKYADLESFKELSKRSRHLVEKNRVKFYEALKPNPAECFQIKKAKRT